MEPLQNDCESEEPKEEGADTENEEQKRGHGGCGHIQQQIRKESLKLFLQYKKLKDDDDVGALFCRSCSLC